MDPRRAWDPRMDPRAGRGDGQQQLPGQQQQQAWEVPWQDQVRGNPQAEYAAIAQARGGAAAGVGGTMPPWQPPFLSFSENAQKKAISAAPFE